MSLGVGRLLILVALSALAFITASIFWLAFPHQDLLAVLWKFSFVSATCATIGYQVRNKYSELLDHPSLSASEFRRLDFIVNIRRGRVTFFVLFSLLISIMLGGSNLFIYAPNWAAWYFKFICTGLVIEITLFVLVLLSFREIEKFKSRLDERKRSYEERDRLLKKLNGNET